jgi:hypothetical protein
VGDEEHSEAVVLASAVAACAGLELYVAASTSHGERRSGEEVRFGRQPRQHVDPVLIGERESLASSRRTSHKAAGAASHVPDLREAVD